MATIKGQKFAKNLLKPDLAKKVFKANSFAYATYLLLAGSGALAAATAVKVNSLNIKKGAEEYHRQEEIKALKEQAKNLNGKEVSVKIKCGENGRIFGSVTTKEIADAINELGFNVDKKKISLKDTIKNLGTYTVEVKFLPEVIAKVKVVVVAE